MSTPNEPISPVFTLVGIGALVGLGVALLTVAVDDEDLVLRSILLGVLAGLPLAIATIVLALRIRQNGRSSIGNPAWYSVPAGAASVFLVTRAPALALTVMTLASTWLLVFISAALVIDRRRSFRQSSDPTADHPDSPPHAGGHGE